MSYIKVVVDAGASGYGPATVTEVGVEDANAYFLRPNEAYWFDDCCDPLAWEPGSPLTAATVTEQDLRDLFARHCECRPLDLERWDNDHAAIHDCDTAILFDVQIALGFVLQDDVDREQAIREARGRCAEVINAARKST